jgi:uncharacterized SAM-binding protein YcdF (DUF218 family)|tara:strand:+ start:366 stop:1196 length:831 start_codon:yes stop_codon:yes gene_type:complete
MGSVFFFTSKIVWALITPGSLLVILGMFAWLSLVAGWQKISRLFLSLTALFLLLVGTLPLGEWLISPLENRFAANAALPMNPAGVIVLGGAVNPALSDTWGQTEIGGAAERLTAFIYLANLYPDTQLVFTGGSGSLTEQAYKEADYTRFLFEQLDMGDRAIIYESESRNTAENALHSMKLLNPQAAEEWILITSAFHMPRAVGVFCQAGWPVTPYPVDHYSDKGELLRVDYRFSDNLRTLETAIHEWVSLLAYRITRQTDRLLPGDQNQCGVETGA